MHCRLKQISVLCPACLDACQLVSGTTIGRALSTCFNTMSHSKIIPAGCDVDECRFSSAIHPNNCNERMAAHGLRPGRRCLVACDGALNKSIDDHRVIYNFIRTPSLGSMTCDVPTRNNAHHSACSRWPVTTMPLPNLGKNSWSANMIDSRPVEN
jgi:hypothetical protein